jgi:hypothetical protein
MLVRDSRSPRGRYEASGPPQDYYRIQALGAGFFPAESGFDWHTQGDRSMEARRRADPTLMKRPPKPPRTQLDAICKRPDCRADFKTVHPKQIYCSGRCRAREYKRRARAQ